MHNTQRSTLALITIIIGILKGKEITLQNELDLILTT